MFLTPGQPRCRSNPVQAAPAPVWRASRVLLVLCVAGCDRNPVLTPVDWWHDLQGGEIASTRPPPPGADLPYPHLATVPARPAVPTAAFRTTVQAQLIADRDSTERLATRTPIDVTAPPPPPKPPAPAPAVAADDNNANATLPAADGPPAPIQPVPKRAATALAPDGGHAIGTPVIMAGDPGDMTGLPEIPSAPPAPATFETVAAQPEPSPAPPAPVEPTHGDRVLFATGQAVLNPSQGQTLGEVVTRIGKGSVTVDGHGDAASDTPGAQQAALELGLKRANAIADALIKRHIAPGKILLSATAFGRDATLHVIPAPIELKE